MRYLKKFNENVTKSYFDIFKDFCEEHFLFLKDENYLLQYYYQTTLFDKDGNKDVHRLFICKAGYELFNWDDINSDILQFMDFLKNEYEIKFLEFRFYDSKNNYEDDFTVPVRDFFDKSFKWDNLDLLDEEIFEVDEEIKFIQMDVIIPWLEPR